MNPPESNIDRAVRIAPGDVVRTLGRTMLVDGFHIVLDLEKSRGSRLYDAASGKWYLDFYTFFASCPVGMNHPALLAPEFTKKLLRAAINKPANSDVYTVEMAEFVATLERVAMPASMKYLFLVEGGAVAVSNALKVAFDWKVKKNLARGKGELGSKVIHFREAFHGRTGYTLSLTNTDPIKVRYFPKHEWPRVENPKLSFPLSPAGLEAVKLVEDRAVAQIEEAFRANPDDVAAIVIEPIQGEGGDNHFRGEFLARLRRLCDEHEALLILDEVQTGVGLTGKMWAYQHFGFEPDVIAFGKKMQVCGVMASGRVDDVADNVFRKSGRINSTWGGNLTDMVRGERYLQIIEEEGLVAAAARSGELLLGGLCKLEQRYAGKVSNARGRGLMCAFDLESPELRDAVKTRCHAAGLLVLPSGAWGIRFRPALNVSAAELEEGLALLDKALGEAVSG